VYRETHLLGHLLDAQVLLVHLLDLLGVHHVPTIDPLLLALLRILSFLLEDFLVLKISPRSQVPLLRNLCLQQGTLLLSEIHVSEFN
jgi:hypothetical protein